MMIKEQTEQYTDIIKIYNPVFVNSHDGMYISQNSIQVKSNFHNCSVISIEQGWQTFFRACAQIVHNFKEIISSAHGNIEDKISSWNPL
jgi:hypothetical protein